MNIQETMLIALWQHQSLVGETPSIRTLHRMLQHKGMKISVQSVHNYLGKLERRGWIIRKQAEPAVGAAQRSVRSVEITPDGMRTLAVFLERQKRG
jgi:DNA-binding PadR family transcriptional regulator